MVNGNVLTGQSLLQLHLTPDQIFWGLGFNIRIKLRKKIERLGLPVFSRRVGWLSWIQQLGGAS